MKITEALQQATTLLADAGVADADVNAQWLMTHLVGCSRSDLALKLSHPLSAKQQALWDEIVTKRIQRIPLQHIIGTVNFCGLELAVDNSVLVPRPETELLAEAAWSMAAAMDQAVVLDIGTGSGCLAISIAMNAEGATVHALDICPKALKVARSNARRHGVSSRITFHEADMRRPLPMGGLFDLIVSNPPYIPSRDIETLEVEVREHDPRLALDGGKDGLDYYRYLIASCLPCIRSGGRFLLEVGDGQVANVAALIGDQGGRMLEILPDLNNVERIVVASPVNS